MAPETPGNLLVLNMRYDASNQLIATIEAIEPWKVPPPTEFLHVRFDANAKEFDGRVAVYFRPPEKFGATATITWGLKEFTGSAQSEAKRLRGEIVRSGNPSWNPGAYLDREDPEFKEPQRPTRVGRTNDHAAGQPLSANVYVLIALAGLICAIGFTLFYIACVRGLRRWFETANRER